jgi:hypothetical protein
VFEDAVQIFCDVAVPEAQLGYAALLEPRAATLIARALRSLRVLSAIEVNRKAQLRTIKIQNVITSTMLAPEA